MRFTIRDLIWLTVVIGLGSALAKGFFVSSPYSGATHDIEGITYFDRGLSEFLETTIPRGTAEQSPPWNPAEPNPPVSARDALVAADKFRRKHLGNRDGWQWGLESVALLPLDGKSDRWCWSITFMASPSTGAMSGPAPECTVFVLMNGKLVIPKIQDYDFLKDHGMIEGIMPTAPAPE